MLRDNLVGLIEPMLSCAGHNRRAQAREFYEEKLGLTPREEYPGGVKDEE